MIPNELNLVDCTIYCPRAYLVSFSSTRLGWEYKTQLLIPSSFASSSLPLTVSPSPFLFCFQNRSNIIILTVNNITKSLSILPLASLKHLQHVISRSDTPPLLFSTNDRRSCSDTRATTASYKANSDHALPCPATPAAPTSTRTTQ